MRRILTVMVLVACSAGQGGLLACGDKFFLVGRGDPFSRAYASLHPGSIVIYTGGPTATSKALGDGRLQKYFTRAGHRVTVARDSTALAKALDAGSVDLVLAGTTEALAMLPRIDSVSSKPTVMSVDDGNPAMGTTRHLFKGTLKTSDKINGFLAKIEDAMKTRTSSAGRS